MTLSTPKKIVFVLIAITLPLLFIELTSYALVRIFFPQAYAESKKTPLKSASDFRIDYSGNDFSKEDYDYSKDFYGPYLHDTSLTLPERLIGPRAWTHYLRTNEYTLFPFTMFHLQRNYHSAIVNTNHLGFRAKEFSNYEKDPRPKIIILGGSAIFGTNLTSDEKTISAQLESFLHRHGKDVVCINLAMGGYTSEQEMITLSRIGMRFKPSMVIAIDGYNDVGHYLRNRDLPLYFTQLASLYYGGIPPNSSPGIYLKALVKQLGKYSSFFCLAGKFSGNLKSTSSQKDSQKMDNCVLFPDRSDENATKENFINSHVMMFSLCKGRNIGYIAGLQPVCGIWVDPRWEGEESQSFKLNTNFVKVYASMDKDLNVMAKKEGFPYLNFGKILAEEDNKLNFSDGVHLTDMSSQIMAHKLGEIILRSSSENKSGPFLTLP